MDALARAEVDLEGWYRSHGEAVFRRCRRILGDEAAARDATQDAFIRAHRYQRSYRGGSPLAWLARIADRVCFDQLKKRKLDVPTDALSELFVIEDLGGAPTLEVRDAVANLLSRASEREQQVVMCRYFDELSLEETAALLGVNERTVRRTLEQFVSRAHKRLKGVL